MAPTPGRSAGEQGPSRSEFTRANVRLCSQPDVLLRGVKLLVRVAREALSRQWQRELVFPAHHGRNEVVERVVREADIELSRVQQPPQGA